MRDTIVGIFKLNGTFSLLSAFVIKTNPCFGVYFIFVNLYYVYKKEERNLRKKCSKNNK